MFVCKIAAIAAATIATVAVTASIAPATASASTTGTVTVKEGKRVIRAADRQKCLTLKETRKIVHGRGVLVGKDQGTRYQTWNGKGKADFLDVVYDRQGCAAGVWLVYKNNDQLDWYDWTSSYWTE